MYAVRFVIGEFDLNYYASTDLNQFYPSDFDLKMTILLFDWWC